MRGYQSYGPIHRPGTKFAVPMQGSQLPRPASDHWRALGMGLAVFALAWAMTLAALWALDWCARR